MDIMAKKKTDEPTPEQKEKDRTFALKNLRGEESNVPDLAVAYLTSDEGVYGGVGSGDIEKYKYLPAIEGGASYIDQNGEKKSLIASSLLGSRKGGKRYSGTASEFDLIEAGHITTQRALGNIKVQDVLDLMGSEGKLPSKYADKFVSDLNKDDEEDKKVLDEIENKYNAYLLRTKLVEATNEAIEKDVVGGLEKEICETKEA